MENAKRFSEVVMQSAADMVAECVKPRKVPDDKVIADTLERHGFLRSVAGDDFGQIVRAVSESIRFNRGILVVGNPGCGKTRLLRTLMSIYREERWRYVSMTQQYASEWLRDTDDYDYDYLTGNIYLDEIGSEEILREYGNVVDVVGGFIQRYYERRKRCYRFYGASNLGVTKSINGKSDERTLLRQYGPRVLDRLAEMCVMVQMTGKSKRRKIVIN